MNATLTTPPESHSDLIKRHATDLHEHVLQGLVVAKLAFELGRADDLRDALHSTLEKVRAMVATHLELGDLQLAGDPRRQPINARLLLIVDDYSAIPRWDVEDRRDPRQS